MRNTEFNEGIAILSKYRKSGYIVMSETDKINASSTEIPVDIEDFNRLIYLGFVFEAGLGDWQPCIDPNTGRPLPRPANKPLVYCYSIYIKNAKGEWLVLDYA